jgi:predicted ATP-grasp superfamily ATP-dependent carboligase
MAVSKFVNPAWRNLRRLCLKGARYAMCEKLNVRKMSSNLILRC